MANIAHTKTGFNMLKLFIKRLQNQIKRHVVSDELNAEENVPDDVKEGHFAILAAKRNGVPERFVVNLCLLKNPEFLRLLKLAEEEYGFEQKGTLTVPCQPEELQQILRGKI